MTKKWITMGMFVMSAMLATAQTQESAPAEFKPSGKMDGRIFSNFHTVLTEGADESGFEVKRAYWGYTYTLSPDWSARVLLDVGFNNAGQNAFFKNAALNYNKDKWKVSMGMVDTYSMKVQEKIWGKRYIEKSYLDNFGFSNTADLGVNAMFSTGVIAIDGGIYNGEGYKSTQNDNMYRGALGVTAYLLDEKLVLRVGDEVEADSVAQVTSTFFAGYSGSRFSAGAEYNIQANSKHNDGVNRGGYSVFASFSATEKLAVFGRYEMLATDGASVNARDGGYYIGGVEYKVVKNLRGSLNLQGFQSEATSDNDKMMAFVNLEVSF